MIPFAYLLALIWGAVWAVFLQFHPHGQFLARERTWIAVVAGVGGDLLVLLFVLSIELWIHVLAVITLSSIAIIARSLINEYNDSREIADVIENQVSKQNDLGA